MWICPWPNGHIQAVGFDAAGRRQYLYHPRWREKRDKQKHDHVLDFAATLPELREIVSRELAGRSLTRERVLAAAVRLLDLGFFRVGGDRYAEDNGTYGLATLQREHVSFSHGEIVFCYPAKGGYERVQAVGEPEVGRVIRALRSRRSDGDALLAYCQQGAWHRVHSLDINDYLKELTGLDVSAKDFRTWNATVLAAVGLAVSPVPRSSVSSRKRAVARVVKEVSQYLGNTPAVCRASYIDPRVIERYQRGDTIADALDQLGETESGSLAIQGPIEEAVLNLLRPGRPEQVEAGLVRLRQGPLLVLAAILRIGDDLIAVPGTEGLQVHHIAGRGEHVVRAFLLDHLLAGARADIDGQPGSDAAPGHAPRDVGLLDRGDGLQDRGAVVAGQPEGLVGAAAAPHVQICSGLPLAQVKLVLSRQDALWFTKVETGPVALRQWLTPVMSPSAGSDPLLLLTASSQFSQVPGLLYAQPQSLRTGPAPNVVPEGKNCSTQLVVLTPAPVTFAGTPLALGVPELAKNVTAEPPLNEPDGVPVTVTPACGDFAPLMTVKVPPSPIVPVYL